MAARVLFVNSAILGHRSMAAAMRAATARTSAIAAAHLELGASLKATERVLRAALCASPFDRTPLAAWNLDFARWRRELHAGIEAARRIAEAEKGHPFDVLFFHTQATAYASLARMRRTPSLVSIDTTQTLAAREAPAGVGAITCWPNVRHDGAVFRRAAAILSASRWAAGNLARVYPDCAAKVHVVPWPVQTDLWPADLAERRRERAAREPGRPVRVLFVGGHFARKGGPALLRAWRAAGLGARARLDLVTAGPLNAPLPAGAHVHLGIAPGTAAWLDLWREADLFVMPTRSEAFGVVFQEAAAAGLPALGTRLNAVPEIVEDAATGLLVPPEDDEALTAALERLIGSPELRFALGRAARERIVRIASPEAYAAQLVSIVERVRPRADA